MAANGTFRPADQLEIRSADWRIPEGLGADLLASRQSAFFMTVLNMRFSRREHERARRREDRFGAVGDSASLRQSNENCVDVLLIGDSLSLSNCGLSVGF